MDFVIRAGEREDAVVLARMALRPAVLHDGAGFMPFMSLDDARQRIEKLQEEARSGVHLVAAIPADNTVVGLLMLRRSSGLRAHVATLGLAVHDDWHRRGIGAALLTQAIRHADDWLGLGRITLNVASDNVGAIALYERHGFQHEGRLRAEIFRAGRYVDMLAMARSSPAFGHPPLAPATA